jgi:putative oxidoreductase
MRLSRFAEKVSQPVAPVLTRIVLGAGFFRLGMAKWENLGRIADSLATAGIPYPQTTASFLATLQLLGGATLVIGFKTRLFSFLLSCTMLGALLTVDQHAFLLELSFDGGRGLWGIASFVALLLLVWLLASGAGPVSVDRWLLRRFVARRLAAI